MKPNNPTLHPLSFFSAPSRVRMARGGLLALGAFTLACTAALAQPRQVEAGGYTLRSSTVPSTAISAAAATEHQIEPAANRALLNVVVLQGAPATARTVPAQVQASMRDLTGLEREIEMKPAVAANGDVSYLGTYTFRSRAVLDFRIRAQPVGAEPQLELVYREQMPVVAP